MDYVRLQPLLVYRQEGGGRAPRLAPWNATESRQLPIPLFPFPSRPSSCGARVISHGSSVEEQQSQQVSSLQETNPKDGLQSSRSGSSIIPKEKQKRKRASENSSPGRRTKAHDHRGLSSEQDGEQKSAEGLHAPPSSSNPSSLKAPSFSPLTSRSGSSVDRRRFIPIDLPIDLHESPWHYDPEAHHFAREATRLRLCRKVNVNGASAGSKQNAPSNKATPKPKEVSTVVSHKAPDATGLAYETYGGRYTSEVDEWGLRKICHFR